MCYNVLSTKSQTEPLFIEEQITCLNTIEGLKAENKLMKVMTIAALVIMIEKGDSLI